MLRMLSAALAALALLAEPGGCGSSGGTNAPQAPGPGGGQAQAPQAPPNPAAADPGPHPADIRRQLTTNPGMAALLVTWGGERRFWIEPTTEYGQVPEHIVQRAQTATGGWWVKLVPVRPGQTIGVSAGPADAKRQSAGTAACEVWHVSAADMQAAYQPVAAGPCAVSYTIPVG